MRSIAGVTVGVVTVCVAMLMPASSYAFDSSSFGPAPVPSVLERESSSRAKEMAVLTDQGIAPARAAEALRLQGEVAHVRLVGKIRAALGGFDAGAWFDPRAAKLDVGVVSGAGADRVRRIAAAVGLAGSVAATPVRSTSTELSAAQARWHARLTKLLAAGEAQIGLDSARNAVTVTLSSSVPAAERAALRRQAAAESTNVSIGVSAPAQVDQKKGALNCHAPFLESDPYCEPTIVAGVGIVVDSSGFPKCTAGPMLLEGNETYMVTAGHCFGGINGEGGSAVTVEVTSQYTEGPQLEIGKTGIWYNNSQRDMAIVKVNRKVNNFTQALPKPVPALVTEWEKEPKIPHAVEGMSEAATGEVVCHEGIAVGEKCGEIKEVNVEVVGTQHLVLVNACADLGDSGGPYFLRGTAGEVLMMGVLVTVNECVMPYRSAFEPLADLEGSPEKGILSTFHPKELLTKSNESRTATTLAAKWLVAGAEVTTELSAELEGEFTLTDLKSLLGVAEVLCGSLFTSTLLANGEALINEMLSLTGEPISLVPLSGTALSCTNVKNCTEPLVWAVHLPWTALLELVVIEETTKEPYAVLFKPGTEGNPGLYVECMGGFATTDECTASELIAEAKNGETAAELIFAEKLREELFAKLGTCTMGGSEQGHLTTGSGDANELVFSTGGVVSVGS